MTVSSTTRKAGPFAGNGTQTTFPFSFKVYTTSDVAVTRADASGIETVLTLNSDYTVSLNSNQDTSPGGNVVLGSALASGYALSITGNLAYSQSTQLPSGGAYNAQNVEQAFDRVTMLTQQLLEQVGRAVKVSVSSGIDPSTYLTSINTSVANAAASATSAAASATSAQSTYNSFRGIYYGAYSSDPSVDPLGAAPTTGDIYFNTTISALKIYNGTTWVAAGVATPITLNTQQFSGNGSTTVFTLTNPPAFQNAAEVYISGVRQVPGVDYTVTGSNLTTLTFTTAPPAGTSNIFVQTAIAYAGGVPNDGSVTAAKLDTSGQGGTGAAALPSGTTAQRPASPALGFTRYNNSTGQFEGYGSTGWAGLGGAQAGGVIYENSTTLTSNYTLTTGKNGMLAGPITINTGVSLTVPTGQRLVIL